MSFDKFIKQYNATGREKLDGYSSFCFDEMTEEEKINAESLLLIAAERMDTTAFQGLSLIKSETGRALLERMIIQVKPPSLTHLHAAEFLYEMTGENWLQEEITKNMDKSNKFIYELSIVILSETHPTLFLFNTMRDIIMNVSDEGVARSVASRALFRCFGFPDFEKDQAPERISLHRRLFNARSIEVDHIIEEIKEIGVSKGYVNKIN
ncbi:MAG: hypothetical protein LBV45_10160 [Xanthomonadaceae bacterium]|jgi:hypothetical protein|nr:hypothetical protein [Xanthomonadaceae bacterium]